MVLRGQLSCKECQIEKYGMSYKRVCFDDAKQLIENQGYTLLSTTFNTTSDSLDVQCLKHNVCATTTYAQMLNNYSPCVPCATEKRIKSNQEIRGVDYVGQCPKIKRKIHEVVVERYGPNSLNGYEKVNAKKKKTCLERYGVENPMHSPPIVSKWMKSCFGEKKYILPSGLEISCQGYEPFCFDELILKENISELDILEGKDVPIIPYSIDGSKHIYHPDIYLPISNTLIEVKSTWTLGEHLDVTIAKLESARSMGFNVELRIYGPNEQRLFIPQFIKYYTERMHKFLTLSTNFNDTIASTIFSYVSIDPLLYSFESK